MKKISPRIFITGRILAMPVFAMIAFAGRAEPTVVATKKYVDSGLATRISATVFNAFQNRQDGFATAAQGAKADSALQAEALTDYLPKSGGTMTGMLTLSAPPTADLHAATKRYVDAAVAGLDTSSSANVYDFGAYQGIYAGSVANWVPDTGASMAVKKIGAGASGEIAIKVVSGQIVCIVPKDLTISSYLRFNITATADGAKVAGAPGSGLADRTCDADGLHIVDNDIIILRQPPALSNANGNWTLYYANFDAARTRQPWDYNIMTYDGGVLNIGAHAINMKNVAVGSSIVWTGGSM